MNPKVLFRNFRRKFHGIRGKAALTGEEQRILIFLIASFLAGDILWFLGRTSRGGSPQEGTILRAISEPREDLERKFSKADGTAQPSREGREAPLPSPSEARKETTAPLKLDLNRAAREDLLLLPGIGEELATRILRLRSERGPFENLEELLEVRGIGPKTLEKLRPYLYISNK